MKKIIGVVNWIVTSLNRFCYIRLSPGRMELEILILGLVLMKTAMF